MIFYILDNFILATTRWIDDKL